MPIEIIVPRLGWSMEEGAFVAWHKQEGDRVQAGDPLFSIEGDKAVQEIESMDSGILRIAPNGPKPGDAIRVGEVLGHLVPSADWRPESGPAGFEAIVSKPASAAPQSAGGVAGSAPPPRTAPAGAPGVPAISPRARRVAAELGVDWTQLKGSGRSGRIHERDVRASRQ